MPDTVYKHSWSPFPDMKIRGGWTIPNVLSWLNEAGRAIDNERVRWVVDAEGMLALKIGPFALGFYKDAGPLFCKYRATHYRVAQKDDWRQVNIRKDYTLKIN